MLTRVSANLAETLTLITEGIHPFILHFQFGMTVSITLYAGAALVDFTRIYASTSARYPRDVIAGIVLGSLAVLAFVVTGKTLSYFVKAFNTD